MNIYPTRLIRSVISVRNGLTDEQNKRYHQLVKRRLPVNTHMELAVVLRSVERNKHVDRVKCVLDDIVQCEYPSQIDLPNDVFRGMYYGRQLAGRFSVPIALLEVKDWVGGCKEGFDPRYPLVVTYIDKVLRRHA